MKKIISAFAVLAFVSACATPSGQNQYQSDEVGMSSLVEFATVLNVRNIDITGKNSGAGALAGASLGAAGGSGIGNGSGQIMGVVGGAVVGAIAGAVAEQAMTNGKGVEYTLVTEKGKPMTVAQNLNKGDHVFQQGDRVIIQTSGSYQRVLPAGQLPEEVKRPKGLKVVD